MTAVPMDRLLRVQLRIWLAQRGVVIGAVLALALGLAVVALGSAASDEVSFSVYATVWLAIGALAGAAPFRSRWAPVVLVVAPRRLRWFATCFVSLLAIAMAVTVAFALLTAAIAASHGTVGDALTHLWQPLVAVAVDVSVGFFLGAATRATAAALTIAYVVSPMVSLLVVGPVDVGHWLNLSAAVEVVTAARLDGGLPTVTALFAWLVAPAVIAAWRLRHRPIR